jgi:hypothetical protein
MTTDFGNKDVFMWTAIDLTNESDVEQKFIYPFLIEREPLGLGLPPSVVQTKTNIRRLPIGKGKDQKSYFPDYLIVNLGFPLVVIEAKHPSEALDEGYREARMYASELNALFRHGLDPAHVVAACNGIDIWYGYYDQAEPLGIASCAAFGAYSTHMAKLADLIKWDRLKARSVDLARQSNSSELFKPRRLLGGLAFQNEEVGQNSFGATLTTAISAVFNPHTAEERALVARDAYVPSKRRERYIDPIDRVIRAARPPSESQALVLEDTSNPSELIGKLKLPAQLEHKVLLLIGSVGSGKSTFVDHLFEVALPPELLETTVRCRINMNAAPVTPAEIYSWLRREIIAACKSNLSSIDFDDIESIKKVFGIEIQQFNKGIGQLLKDQKDVYAVKLAETIERVQRDQTLVANAYVRFTCAQRAKLLILVLDNCDKKTRDEQLLMFEAAQWLQKEFRCLVILPLRDETYDNHRDQPPLDTALKDLVFRIEPPMFQHVLMKRVSLALKTINAETEEKLHFELPNGFRVEYPRHDQAFYLTSIVKSLFEHDRFARRMIVGLSGRNMRRALEIFLEFCNSGHIGEDQIFQIRQSEGQYILPFYQVATVLLRMNRRFYDGDHSYIKNIFGANRDDSLPSYFCRYIILKWLRANFQSAGTGGLKGYFPKREIKQALLPYGLEPDVVDREFNYLLAAQCVIAEHLRVDSLEEDDLVRLGPAGFAHLDLVGNINYLAAVAEDTLFTDRLQAEKVSNRIRNPNLHLQLSTVVDNADELVRFLESTRAALLPENGPFMASDSILELTDIADAREAVSRVAKSHEGEPWFSASRDLPRGSVHPATVVNIREFGHFVEFDNGLIGLVHKTKLCGLSASPGDRVMVEVLWVDAIAKKMGLKLKSIVEEEVGDLFVDRR